MRNNSKLFARLQAIVLTLAMLFSVAAVAMPVAVSAAAASKTTLTDGKIVAENYALTDAEKALIASDYLAGGKHTYSYPEAVDDLITVDEANKKITAESYEEEPGYKWEPVKAEILVGGANEEDVALTAGVGTYNYDGNAFAVKVTYELRCNIDAAVQETLLNTPTWLKQGVANLKTVSGQSGNLYILEQAMPELVNFANNGITVTIGGSQSSVDFSNECKAAVKLLNDQMTANGGKLTLSVKAAEIDAAASTVEYLLTKGAAAKAETVTLYNNASLINTALQTMVENLTLFIQKGWVSQATAAQLTTLSGVCNNLTDALAGVAADKWTAAEKGTALVATGIDAAGYAALDTLVAALGALTAVPAVTNPLLVDKTSVQYNMSMSNVTVEVVLKVVDTPVGSSTLVTKDTNTTVLTLVDGATKAEILAAVDANGIVADSLTEWAGAYVADKFEVTKTALPDAVSGDITYTITYSPKKFDVTYVYGGVESYYYGTRVELPVCGGSQVYDYTVDGVYYAEGSVIVINDAITVDRTTGKPYVNSNLYEIVSDRYLTAGDKASSILTSGALNGNFNVNVRYPDNESGTLVQLTGNVLNATNYPASYEGLEWIPYSYTVVNGSARTEYKFTGNSATITDAAYDRIEVVYRLALTNISDADILAALNLPAELADEANAQITVLDKLSGASVMNNLGLLDKLKFGALKGVVDVSDLHADPATNAALKNEFKAIIDNIVAECLDTDNYLKLYNMLLVYTDANNGGLKYYYNNSAAVIAEISLLSDYLAEMLSTPEKQAALVTLATAAGYGEYADKISSLSATMTEVKNALTAPNAAIDLSSSNLNKLIDALGKTGTVATYTTVPGDLYLTSETFTINASDKISTSITVQVAGGKHETVNSDSFNKTHVLDANDIQTLKTLVTNAFAKLGIDAKYYNTDYVNTAFDALVGKSASELAYNYTYTWTPKTYTVKVEGMVPDQTISVNDLEIDLAASPDSSFRYEYMIDGGKVASGVYTFTLEQIDRLFGTGSYSVSLVKTDIGREKLIALVNGLNAGVGNDSIVFALTENGSYSIIMKVDGSGMGALQSGLPGMVNGIINGGYAYIGRDGGDLLYTDGDGKLAISMQSVINAVMNSGFGSATLLSAMDANGNANDMALPGTVISAKAMSAAGGKLIATTLQLGNTKADAISVPLYITIGDSTGPVLQLRNLFAGQLGNNINFTCANGEIKLDVTVPDKAYQAYLAALLVTGEVDLSNINSVNAEIAFTFAQDILAPMLTDEVTLDSYLNTLAKIGYNLNLGANKDMAAKAFNTMKDTYNGASFVYDQTSASAALHISIKSILDAAVASAPTFKDLLGMVDEYNNGIDLAVKVALGNIGTTYEALFVDLKAAGVTNKAGLTANLAGKTFSGASVIVLLQDVTANLKLDYTTIINLNGYTLNGNITGSGNVTVVDSSMTGNGKLNGTYPANVSVMPGSKYYTLIENGSEITLTIDAGLLHTTEVPELRPVLLNLVSDLLFNGYTGNKLYVNGNKLYDITINDLVSLYADSGRGDKAFSTITGAIDSVQLANILNDMIAKLTDFGALASAIEADREIMEYSLLTSCWKVEGSYVSTGDYVSANIVSGTDTTKTLKVVVGGTAEDKAAAVALLKLMDKTVEIDLPLVMTQTVSGSKLNLNWSAALDLKVDFSASEYGVMVSVILAKGLGASENAALVEGIKAYYSTQNITKLKSAFDALTTAQIIRAVKGIEKTDTFASMVNDLGLNSVVPTAVYEAGTAVEGVLRIMAAALRKVSVTGDGRTMADFISGKNIYMVDKENVKRSFNLSVGGYSVALNAAINSIDLALTMFGEEPILPPYMSTPTVGSCADIAGSRVDAINKYIILDVKSSGITVGTLKHNLLVHAANDGVVTLTMDRNDTDLVCNGDTITLTSQNSAHVLTETYVIIVLGDTNANGRIDVADAVGICEDIMAVNKLKEYALMAADINGNGRLDVADVVGIDTKIVDWSNYESPLKA